MASAALNPQWLVNARLRYIEFVVNLLFVTFFQVIFLSLAMFSRSMPITLAFFYWQFLKALMKSKSLFQFFSSYRDPKLLLLLEVVAENLIFDWQWNNLAVPAVDNFATFHTVHLESLWYTPPIACLQDFGKE